jgi:inner membrane transporter RhtA
VVAGGRTVWLMRTDSRAVLTLFGSGVSNQAGAALGALAFGAVGPAGVVAVRQLVAAAVLVPVARPNYRRMTWTQWWPALLLGLVFAAMNLLLYSAVARIGLGLSITLEFLGPLAVGLAGGRSRRMLGCALGAGLGVVVLVAPGPSTDWAGIAPAGGAAVCWAGYILLNRVVGRRLAGLRGTAVASSVSAAIYLPVAVVLVLHGRFDSRTLLLCMGTGILSSVIPYAIDVMVLRQMPAAVFGIVMSLNPLLAALAGLIVLGQDLRPWQWPAIALIVAANAGAVTATQSRTEAVTATQSRTEAVTAPENRTGAEAALTT